MLLFILLFLFCFIYKYMLLQFPKSHTTHLLLLYIEFNEFGYLIFQPIKRLEVAVLKCWS